eukprot:1159475-Pelagomonas_calceolata.AAC.4
MLVEKLSPGANQPEPRAVGQPLANLVTYGNIGLDPQTKMFCNFQSVFGLTNLHARLHARQKPACCMSTSTLEYGAHATSYTRTVPALTVGSFLNAC